MNSEIVYVCNSTNNKNIRGNELKILRKNEKELYFEFGESEKNIKKRYYTTIENLNKDFEEIEKIKIKIEKNEKEIKKEKEESISENEKESKEIEETEEIEEVEKVETKKSKSKEHYKRLF